MCEFCNPDSDSCEVNLYYDFTGKEPPEYYLEIECSEWDNHNDGFITHKVWIDYCPYCGRKLSEEN